MNAAEQIQTILRDEGLYLGAIDGILGAKSKQAFADLAARTSPATVLNGRSGLLSSFADPDDVAAFHRCKAQGRSDSDCFSVGDNGIGAFGDNTAQDQVAMCALPPERIIARWGSVAAGKHKPVIVEAVGRECICVLADLMPHEANIHNGAICDLNPGAAKVLGLLPPFLVQGSYRWA